MGHLQESDPPHLRPSRASDSRTFEKMTILKLLYIDNKREDTHNKSVFLVVGPLRGGGVNPPYH